MTPRQNEALKFIKGYIKLRGYSPSIRDIANGMKTNVSNAHRIVTDLKDDGFISMERNRARTIEVLR